MDQHSYIWKGHTTATFFRVFQSHKPDIISTLYATQCLKLECMYGLIFCYPTLCKELKIEEAISFSRQFLLNMFLFLREFLLLTKWNEQRSSIPWDKRGAWSPKSFFLPFGPQVGLKIKGGWAPQAPLLDPSPPSKVEVRYILPLHTQGRFQVYLHYACT